VTAPPASFLATRRGRLTLVPLCAPAPELADPPSSAATPRRPAANR